MEQYVELIVRGNVVKVAAHMVADFEKFGATKTRKVIKEAPAELLKIPIKEVKPTNPLPEMTMPESYEERNKVAVEDRPKQRRTKKK
jgi:hypothetical protein